MANKTLISQDIYTYKIIKRHLMKKNKVELIVTFKLVFCGCGSALFATTFTDYVIELIGFSLGFGISLLTIIYTISPISGYLLNHASYSKMNDIRMPSNEVFRYPLIQILGAILAVSVLYAIQTVFAYSEIGRLSFDRYGENLLIEYILISCFLTDFVLTFFFLLIILNKRSNYTYDKFSEIVTRFFLKRIHLVSIPNTNTTVFPKRSLS